MTYVHPTFDNGGNVVFSMVAFIDPETTETTQTYEYYLRTARSDKVWSAWEQIADVVYDAQYLQVRIEVTNPVADGINDFGIILYADPITEDIFNFQVPSAGNTQLHPFTIVPSKTFRTVLNVSFTTFGSFTDSWTYALTDVSNPAAIAADARSDSPTSVTPNINMKITGY